MSVDEAKLPWLNDNKKGRFLVRMVRGLGGTYEEVKLEKDSNFGPCCIFRICAIAEIFDVKWSLEDF